MFRRLTKYVSVIFAALFAPQVFAVDDLATSAATQIAAASTSVNTYGSAILGVLVVIAIATILFGMTRKAH